MKSNTNLRQINLKQPTFLDTQCADIKKTNYGFLYKFLVFFLFLNVIWMGQGYANKLSDNNYFAVAPDPATNVDKVSIIRPHLATNAEILLETSFSGFELPDGWGKYELGDEGHGWNNIHSLIWANSWQHEGFHVAGELVTPEMDGSGLAVIILGININYFYYPIPAGMTDAEIRYSTDGESWETFFTFTESFGGTVLPYFEWDISEIASDQDEFYLKFWFDDQEERRGFWQISNVIVYSPTAPQFTIDPELTEWDFGDYILEGESDPKSFTITNTGFGTLEVDLPMLADPVNYHLIYNFNDFPAQLEFSESVSFQVQFIPLEDGILNTDLTIHYNDGEAGQYQIAFTGTGIDPTVTAFPWTEIFQQFEFPAFGWTYVNGVEGAYWQGSGVESHTGSRSVRAYYGPSSGYEANEWLISPPLDLDQEGAELLYFYTMTNFAPDNQTEFLEVWLLPEVYDNVEDLEANGTFFAEVSATQNWERKSFDITGLEGVQHLAFRYLVQDAGVSWRLVYLDNVNIEEIEIFNVTMLEPNGDEGTISLEPGTYSFFAGDHVPLKADAEYAWSWDFYKWEVNGDFYSHNPDTIVTVESDIFVQAYFASVPPNIITMQQPVGEGTVMPGPGQHHYVSDTRLSIGAKPAKGWNFLKWEKDGAFFSNDPILNMIVDSNAGLQAHFVESDAYQTVTFLITDDEGNSLDDAVIRLGEVVNPSGIYTFFEVFAGIYRFSVDLNGYLKTGGVIEVVDEDVDKDVVMEPLPPDTYTVSFNVINVEGDVMENAEISLNNYSNAPGNHIFEYMPPGQWEYQVYAEGYQPAWGFVDVGTQDIEQEVVIGGNFRFFYEDFSDNVIPGGWQVYVHGDNGLGWEVSDEIAKIEPDYDHHSGATLVTPMIDVSDVAVFGLGLHHSFNPYSNTVGEIRYSTDGLVWHTAHHFDDSQGDWIDLPRVEYFFSGLEQESQVYLSFYFDDFMSFSFYSWQIDIVELFEPTPLFFNLDHITHNQYIDVGNSASYHIQLNNLGGLADTYTISLEGGSWSYSYPDQLTLAGGVSEIFELEVHVPQGLNMGFRDSLMLVVNSQSDSYLTDTLEIISVSVAPIFEDYNEDFNVAIPPALPGGWSKVEQSINSWSRVITEASLGIVPYLPPNNVRMNNQSDPDAILKLISPVLHDDVHLSEFRVRFWLRMNPSATLSVGTMSGPDGEFNELDVYESSFHVDWVNHMYNFSSYEGTDRYIAFRKNSTQGNTGAYLDDIHIEIIPPPIFSIDNESWDYGENWENVESNPKTFTIKNTGDDALIINRLSLLNNTDFNIYFDSSDLPIALSWNEEFSFDVSFHPASDGVKTGQVRIEFNDGSSSMFFLDLQGESMIRPAGSTCDNPIFIDLDIVEYAGTTEGFYWDYGFNWITPASWGLSGSDKVFQFTLEEQSFLNGNIQSPNGSAAMFILKQCPNPDNPAQVYQWAVPANGYSFEYSVQEAGDYYAIISSNHQPSNTDTPWTEFEFNLSAEPMPTVHNITFNTYEDSDTQMTLQGVRLHITGPYNLEGTIFTNINGQAFADILAGEYNVDVFKSGYEPQQITINVDDDKTVNIALQDLIWTPQDLAVTSEDLPAGDALFTWNPKPLGEPWSEGFEDDFPPEGWDQIITNDGDLIDEGVDWLFTWQQYGTVYFSDATVIPHEGDYHAFIMWSTDPQDEWLITHEFTAPADDLVFWYRGINGSNVGDNYYVKVSTDDGESWMPIWNASDLPSGTNHYNYPAVIDLSNYAYQQIRLAWHAEGPIGLMSSWFVDAITVGDTKFDVRDLVYYSGSSDAGQQKLTGTMQSSRDGLQPDPVQIHDMNYPDNHNAKIFSGFNVYLDDLDNHVAFVTETEYLFSGLANGNYTAGVQAIYTTGVSEIVSLGFTISDGTDVFTVSFTVMDALGEPIEDAVITLGDITNEAGDYVFENIAPGQYLYAIERLCYLSEEAEITVEANATIEAVLGELPGDANGDGVVNVLDVIIVSNFAVGNEPPEFCYQNADVNGDGFINVLDVIAIINIFSDGKIDPHNELQSQTANIYLNRDGITLISDGTLAGIQFEISGADELIDLKPEVRIQGLEILYTYDSGTLRAIIFSLNNEPIPAGEVLLIGFNWEQATILTLEAIAGNLNADEVPVVIHNEMITDTPVPDDFNFKAYPNPTGDYLWIEFNNPLQVSLSLINVHGRLVKTKQVDEQGKNRLQLDVGHLPAGIYMLRLDYKDGFFVERIVIK